MSIVPIITGTIAAGAAAAAAKQTKEEEQMATYNRDDLDGWEFKIMRSTFGKFSSQQAIEKVCAEESPAGWELVEKFDQHRLRFKRRVERRSSDHMASVDPYRTSVGTQISTSIGIVVGLLLLLVGVAAFVFIGYQNGSLPPLLGSSPIMLVGVLVLVIGVVVMVVKRRS